MKEDLVKLYNTLKLINTKGDDTKIMAKCLDFMEEMIKKADQPKPEIPEVIPAE